MMDKSRGDGWGLKTKQAEGAFLHAEPVLSRNKYVGAGGC
jgi:hypothetical protein